jgi:purine-nucleoside phosphorylase
MTEQDLHNKIEAASRCIRDQLDGSPEFGIILGTGLGGLAETIENPITIPYAEVPHFPQPRVLSHSGNMLIGNIGGKLVAAMEGRCHFYEGFSLEEITMPVRVMKALGIEKLIVSNAAGGINPQYDRGDLLLIEDHINLMGANPLIGSNDDRLGPRFPDMCRPYDARALQLAEAIALEEGIRTQRGVYLALTGPCLETRAEYRMLKTLGADAVGMSTVPEVIVAVHSGLRTFGISCITDMCLPDALEPVNIQEIIDVANRAEPKISLLVRRLIERWS